MRERILIVASGIAILTFGVFVPRVQAIPIEIQCGDCADLPWWLQLILTLIGLGIAYGLVRLAVRLARRIRDPRRRTWAFVGLLLALTFGFVLLARVAVLVLPD